MRWATMTLQAAMQMGNRGLGPQQLPLLSMHVTQRPSQQRPL